MFALLLLLLLIALTLAAVNELAFPVPRIVWAILALLAIAVVFMLVVGALPDAELGDGRR